MPLTRRRNAAAALAVALSAALAGCGDEASVAATCDHLEELAAVDLPPLGGDEPAVDQALADALDARADAAERAADTAPDDIAYHVGRIAESSRAGAETFRDVAEGVDPDAVDITGSPGGFEHERRTSQWAKQQCGFATLPG